ncbi:MAG: 3-methyl-2-oxobutanoate hydroxymethyltransferase, partial [Nitrospina sp.]
MKTVPVTIPALLEWKKNQRKITALTAYDYSFARFLDEADIDIVLVGDSLGMVSLGYENTLPVTMDEMIHHTRAVRRGIRHA